MLAGAQCFSSKGMDDLRRPCGRDDLRVVRRRPCGRDDLCVVRRSLIGRTYPLDPARNLKLGHIAGPVLPPDRFAER